MSTLKNKYKVDKQKGVNEGGNKLTATKNLEKDRTAPYSHSHEAPPWATSEKVPEAIVGYFCKAKVLECELKIILGEASEYNVVREPRIVSGW